MFTNSTIQSNITQLNGTSFGWLVGFGMYSSSNTTYYYVLDYWNGVYILNDQWSFISFKVFTNPAFMISIDKSLYMTGEYNVWKLDEDFNILINYNPTGTSPFYRGISYNPSNGLLYVAAYAFLKEIQVLNLNLTLIRRISTYHYQPWSITISANQLYVGTNGIILVYQNESLINQFNGCNGNGDLITSILSDPNGYMATSCSDPTNKLYLISPNSSFTGKSIKTPSSPNYIGFDSKGRFIHITWKQISIYN